MVLFRKKKIEVKEEDVKEVMLWRESPDELSLDGEENDIHISIDSNSWANFIQKLCTVRFTVNPYLFFMCKDLPDEAPYDFDSKSPYLDDTPSIFEKLDVHLNSDHKNDVIIKGKSLLFRFSEKSIAELSYLVARTTKQAHLYSCIMDIVLVEENGERKQSNLVVWANYKGKPVYIS